MASILILDRNQQSLYNCVYEGMKKGKRKIQLPFKVPTNSLSFIVKLVVGDHPELIEYNNCTIGVGGNNTTDILILNKIPDNLQVRRIINDKASLIIQECISSNMTVIQRVLSIYKYLIEHIQYDYDDANGIIPQIASHSIQGVLLRNIGVCEGISISFAFIMHLIDVPATVVYGLTSEGDHAWNIIKIKDNYYHIDVTWDLRSKDTVNFQRYDYFCLTDDDLNNRKWDKKIYPKCDSNRYNYFDIMNAVVYTVKEFILIVKENMKNKRDIYVKLNFDKPLSVEEISILIQQIGVSINYLDSYTFQYNDDQNTLYVKL